MFEIKVISEGAEPVNLSEVKEYLRIDSDSSDNDNVLELLITSAREKLEGFLNIYFIPKSVKIEFSSRVFELPYGPAGEITELTRQIGDETPVIVDSYKYYTNGLDFKTLIIKEFNNDSSGWWYPINGGYPQWQGRCIYNEKYVLSLTTGYEELPKLLKHALLLQIDYDYKWQGKEEMDSISPAAELIANRFSRNLPIM